MLLDFGVNAAFLWCCSHYFRYTSNWTHFELFILHCAV